jgi:hypothetical protein
VVLIFGSSLNLLTVRADSRCLNLANRANPGYWTKVQLAAIAPADRSLDLSSYRVRTVVGDWFIIFGIDLCWTAVTRAIALWSNSFHAH